MKNLTQKMTVWLLIWLAAAAVLTACRAQGDDVGTTAPDTDPTSETEAAAPGDLTGWFDYGTALYLRDKFTPGAMTDGIAFEMAKNEKEGFQYLLTAPEDREGLRCEVTDLSDGAGHTLSGEVDVAWYLWVNKADFTHARGFTPCMLLPQDDPYQGGTFDIKAGTARTLFIRYETDKDTVPGTYSGTLSIKQNGEILLSGSVSVRVRDVYYDEKTECQTTIGATYNPHDGNTAIKPGPDSAPELLHGNEMQKIYAEYLLDNRITPSEIPFPNGLRSEGAVEYMLNPRVTLVEYERSSDPDALNETYRLAKENGLLDKFYFGFYDEPHEMEHLGHIIQESLTLNKYYPGFRSMDALLADLTWKDRNIIEQLSDVTTMYCPKISIFNGRIRDVMLKLKAERGDTLFWYTSGSGTVETINITPCTPGADKRVLFWSQYQQNVDGFLYWRAFWWNDHEDVWDDGYMTLKHKFPKSDAFPTDDGVLVYWHPTTGLPVSTLGLESIRDGIEDFQLMKMAEAAVGREAVLAIVEQITTDPIEYLRYEDGSAPVIERLKAELFNLIDPAA